MICTRPTSSKGGEGKDYFNPDPVHAIFPFYRCYQRMFNFLSSATLRLLFTYCSWLILDYAGSYGKEFLILSANEKTLGLFYYSTVSRIDKYINFGPSGSPTNNFIPKNIIQVFILKQCLCNYFIFMENQ